MNVDIMLEQEPVAEKAYNIRLSNVTDGDPVADFIPWGAGSNLRQNRWQPGQSAPANAARNPVTESLDIDHSATIESVCDEILHFKMPREAPFPDFCRRSAAIARAGVHNPKIHHESVVKPLIRHRNVFKPDGLTASTGKTRGQLSGHVEKLQKMIHREQEPLERPASRAGNREVVPCS